MAVGMQRTPWLQRNIRCVGQVRPRVHRPDCSHRVRVGEPCRLNCAADHYADEVVADASQLTLRVEAWRVRLRITRGNQNTRRELAASAIAGALIVASQAAFGQAIVIRVDPSSPQDGPGSLWSNAYHDLRAVLVDARDDTDNLYVILVADGTYRLQSLSQSFNLVAGCSLVGSFAGHGAANPDARDFALTPSILSGDVEDDDDPADPCDDDGDGLAADDNAAHVVVAKP